MLTPREVLSRLGQGSLTAWAWVANIALLAWYFHFLHGHFMATDGLFEETGRPIGRDFVVFWSSAVLTAAGHVLDLFDPEAWRALTAGLFNREVPRYAWAYPPQMLFFILPLAQLPYLGAWGAWSLATLAGYLLATRKAALLFAPATLVNLFIGQTGFLLGALYLGSLRLLNRRPALAGLCIGMLAIKPHFGLMIPIALLASRAWTTIASAALTLCALVLLSGWTFGWEAWRLWLLQALPTQASYLSQGLGHQLSLSAFQSLLNLGAPDWSAWLAQFLLGSIGAVSTWWAFSRLRRGSIAPEAAFSVLLLSTIIATPYIFHYDLTLISPVALWAWQRARKRAVVGELGFWVLIWGLPLLIMRVNALVGTLLLTTALGLTIWSAAQERQGPGINAKTQTT